MKISGIVLLGFLLSGVSEIRALPVRKPIMEEPVKDFGIRQINFIENSWTAALKKAGTEHKYIFVDAYASWCAPCRVLKATTFRNKDVTSFFNKNFVNVALDMEKGDGIKLAEQWNVQEYPTLLILDARGKIIVGTTGLLQPKDLIRFGQEALSKKN